MKFEVVRKGIDNLEMDWEHYKRVDPSKRAQVSRGLFGVHLLILLFKFQFPNPSNLQHVIFS